LGIGAEKRMLYGSDYPFTPERAIVHLMGQMEEGFEGIFEQEERNDVYVGNARALFGLKG
jgi:predicted TIM-barrel fold metal-dependent hydrolase